jgi:heptosyltransferase III
MNAPRRILAVKNKHLGDIILSQPAFWALHRAFPQARLDVLVSPGTRSLVDGFNWIHRVIEAPRKGRGLATLREELRVAKDIALAGYDLVVDFTWSDRAMSYALLSRARERWAIQVTAGSRLKPHVFNRYGTKPDKAWHVIEHERNFLVQAGLPHYEPEFFFPDTPAEETAARTWLDAQGIRRERLVVVHPTSRWLFKCWNDEKVAGLMDWLAERGWQPVMTCGPSDEELSRAKAIIQLCRRPHPTRLGDLNLRELAAFLRQARFFFGMDSAPTHLSAAVGTPAVVLFGPSQLARWRPYGPQHHAVVGNCRCLAVRGPQCDKSRVVECLANITLAAVQATIAERFTPPT